MCRMIAAAGTLPAARLLESLRRMASNVNPGHDHEHRRRGAEYRHEDGWGAAWIADGRIQAVRHPESCLSSASSLAAGPDPKTQGLPESPLILLHARRSSVGSVELANTHPFTAGREGVAYAFCHNGTVDDDLVSSPSAPRPDHRAPQGTTDSEALFHYLLDSLDPARPAESISSALDRIRSYNGMLCFLASPAWILALSWRHPERGKPDYHALWEGWGDGVHVVSSERVGHLGCSLWRKLPHRGVVMLDPGNLPCRLAEARNARGDTGL